MRLKLITVYLLVVSALALVGYISYHGLNQVMYTLQSALQPDEREEEFEQILTLITEAENNIRIFTITEDDAYLEPYNHSIDVLEEHIIKLYSESEYDSMLTASLDSIFDLIQKKIYVQEEIILLVQKVQMPDFYGEVLAEINTLESKLNRPDTTVIEARDSLVKKEFKRNNPEDTAKTEEKKRGFFARLFGINKKEENEAGQVVLDTIKTFDTIAVQSKEPVKLSSAIEQKMNRLRNQEEHIQQQVTQKELDLIRRDDRLTKQVSGIVKMVSDHLSQQAIEKASKVPDLFSRTNKYITITGTLASMLFLVMIFIIMRDFQIILKAKRKIEEEKKLTERLARVKEEFLASMSHEIRTPLNAITGFANHIDEKELSRDDKKHLTIIRNSSTHLLQIVNEILDYSKLDAGRLHLEKTSFNASEILQEVIDSFSQEIKNKKLKLNVDIDNTLKQNRIQGDPFRLRQIISNLISNAIKFTSKGSVNVKAYITPDSMLKLIVEDTGIGISEEKKKLIFDKFTQADTSTTRQFGGTGLGLAIVKKLVDLQEGKIILKSTENKGSTFEIRIPTQLIPGKGIKRKKDKIDEPIDLSGKNILIADDDEYNLLLLEKILHNKNANIKKAVNGKEVITIIENNKFDFIILDLQMPELDGFAVAQKLQELNVDSPRLALSAYVTNEIREECKKTGFAEVILKPFNEEHLIKTINGILRAQRTQKDLQVNPGILDELYVEDTGFTEKMIHIYVKNLDEAIKIFQSNETDLDIEKVRYTAHKLIPSSLHMGIDDLVAKLKILKNIEWKEKNGQKAMDILHETLIIARKTRKKLSEG